MELTSQEMRALRKDLKTLALFIRIYCRERHRDESKTLTKLPPHDLHELTGQHITLCDECTKLLAHAFHKRSHCPMHPKPLCKHCPNHCYHPSYRAQIREVMRVSGKHLLLSGRLDYLLHLLF